MRETEDTQRSLNILCVRLVFCLYAEDAGLFGARDAFSKYISQYEPKDIRRALIDETGRLFKCWENAADQKFSFAYARDWDPQRPLETAFDPDMLNQYLNTALPLKDEECKECVWLPVCVGGCPHRRLHDQKACVGMRDEPEKYVLALHARIGGEKLKKEEQEKKEAQ